MNTEFRVTWVDTKSGDARSIDVATLRTAHETARSLRRADDTRAIAVHAYLPNVFNELSIKFPK